jgi:hypothetical protein
VYLDEVVPSTGRAVAAVEIVGDLVVGDGEHAPRFRGVESVRLDPLPLVVADDRVGVEADADAALGAEDVTVEGAVLAAVPGLEYC